VRKLQTCASRTYPRLQAGLGAFGLVALLALVASTDAHLTYDEVPYLKPVALLHQQGFSLQFVESYPEPAGLLHVLIHWALEPITGLHPPLVRFVNPALMVIAIVLNFLTLRLVGSSQPLAASLSLLGIPFVWVLSGLALTEMPSIALTALSILLMVKAQKMLPEHMAVAVLAALAAGVALGVASLSRALVLVVLGALPCLLMGQSRRPMWTVAAFVLGTLAVTGPIYAVWGGLVPPHSAVPVSLTSFSLNNMTLSIAYAATAMMILAPQWFTLNARLAVSLVAAISALNAASGFMEISVAHSVVAHLPPSLAAVIPRLAGSVMLALAALFLVSSAKNIYTRRSDRIWLFFCVSMLLLIAAPGKVVHQYSSRYTGMASGMMILTSDPFAAPTLWRILGVASGMLIGALTLLSYYSGAN
jgi:4-amino-4-deoxy-L-arabinose transferase-like glycosyltransferase